MAKPDGQMMVNAQDLKAFLEPLPIQKMWGVGKSPYLNSKSLDSIRLEIWRANPMSTFSLGLVSADPGGLVLLGAKTSARWNVSLSRLELSIRLNPILVMRFP